MCHVKSCMYRLNKIWNSFQISFYFGQWFLSQYYVRTCEIFFLIHLRWWILSWSRKYLHIVHVILIFCPFITSIKITWSNNILYIRWHSDLKSNDHLHNRHISLSIDIGDLSIWNSHADQFNVYVLRQAPIH